MVFIMPLSAFIFNFCFGNIFYPYLFYVFMENVNELFLTNILIAFSCPFNAGVQLILHSVLKGFVSVFTEMYFDGVSGIPQLSLEIVGLLLFFSFCHILCSFT